MTPEAIKISLLSLFVPPESLEISLLNLFVL